MDAKQMQAEVVIAPADSRHVSATVAPTLSIEIPGLSYMPNFLSPEQEAALIATIDSGEWSHVLKRRVQHYGWRYDYKSRAIDKSMWLGPLPPWLSVLTQRLRARELLPHISDQAIVNEYVENQGIARHTDCIPCFADSIATISLLEPWEMIFRNGKTKITKQLERGSVAVMSGDARYKWTHELPTRYTEPSGLRRYRRVSMTFRKVII